MFNCQLVSVFILCYTLTHVFLLILKIMLMFDEVSK